ncbi:MAG: tyrosine recombinase [Planctomycetaceae bacterium]
MPPRRRPSAEKRSTPQQNVIAHHLPGFLQYLKAECGLAKNTVRAYESDLIQFATWYGNHGPARPSQIRLQTLTEYIHDLHQRELAASTIGRHLVSIKMLFRYLVLESIVEKSVADSMNSPRLWQHLPRVLSPVAVERLLVEPGRYDRFPLRDRAVLCLLYATGCRASEITGLKLTSLFPGERYARCTGKGNKERIVGLNPVCISAVEAWIAGERSSLAGSRETPWLLLNSRGGQLSRVSIWAIVKKYATRSGCGSEVSPHTLRHSFATHMLAGGAEIRALQEMLGHASIATTQIYTHVEHSRIKAIHSQCHPRG